jgi:Right handed beta helix region
VRAYFAAAVLSVAAVIACSPAEASSVVSRSGVVSVSCTGNPSDGATLQRAIDSSPPGSTIEIEGGVCLLTAGINLPGDRTYAGENRTGTVLKQDANMRFVLASQAYVDNSSTTGNPMTIDNLTVECNHYDGTDGIIVLGWQADVSEVDVNGCAGSGIVDTNTTANGDAIANTSVNSRFDNNFISNSGLYGFEVYDNRDSVTDGFFDDNQVASSGLDAIHLDNAAGWVISGNHLYDDAGDGIYANRLYGTTISDNYIEDFGYREKSGSWYGIVGTADGGIGSTIFNNMIFNDKGETTSARYIYVGITQANYGTGYLSVTGNVIVGVRTSDAGFFFGGGSHKLVVASTGNQVANVGIVSSDTGGVTETDGT